MSRRSSVTMALHGKENSVDARRQARAYDRAVQTHVLGLMDACELRIPLRKTLAWDEELSTLLAFASLGNMAVEQVGTHLLVHTQLHNPVVSRCPGETNPAQRSDGVSTLFGTNGRCMHGTYNHRLL